jgi:hypothetical protein
MMTSPMSESLMHRAASRTDESGGRVTGSLAMTSRMLCVITGSFLLDFGFPQARTRSVEGRNAETISYPEYVQSGCLWAWRSS